MNAPIEQAREPRTAIVTVDDDPAVSRARLPATQAKTEHVSD